MLTPEYLANVTNDLIGLYEDLEDEILKDIARRIKKTNGLTETAQRQAEVLIENGYSLEELEEKLKPFVKDINTEVKDLIKNSSLKHYEDEQKAYKIANKNLIDLIDNEIAQKRINACIDRLIIGSGNITASMGLILDGKDIAINEFYKRKLNQTVLMIGSGAFDKQTAIRKLVNNLADSGIKEINYRNSGKNYSLESSVKMTVRTALNKLTGDISLDNAKDMKQDLMEITAHAGARPSHAVWQGKIVSLSGENEKYLSLDDIAYGDVTGFQGANCRHNWYPFFEGISERAYTDQELEEIDPDPFEFDGKEYSYYDATQKQRQIERSIRKYKRQALMYEELEDSDMLLASRVRLQRQRQLYEDFNKAGNLKSAKENLWSKGYNHSKASREVWATKYLDKYTGKPFLQERLDYINPYTNFKEFIPSKVLFENSKVIFKGNKIKQVERLCETYGGEIEEWSKKVGKIESDKYFFDVHWYEKKGKQHEMKLKYKGEKKI